MQPEERGVCAEESLPKERKSRERISFLSLLTNVVSMNVHTLLSLLHRRAGLSEGRGRYNWKGWGTRGCSVSFHAFMHLAIGLVMAGLGLSAVLSLSGSDSGRSVKLIKRADLPWGEGGEQIGFSLESFWS